MNILNPREINFIVVHCSASPPNEDLSVEQIRTMHLNRGWDDIGYHFVIERDGTLKEGRNLMFEGAHAKGFNHESVSICLIGGIDNRTYNEPEPNYTGAQWACLRRTVEDLRKLFPGASLIGHRDLPSEHPVLKDCPSFDVRLWFLMNEVRHIKSLR